MKDVALLLIGQGSTRSSQPDELLGRYAASLETRGQFAEVRAATLAGIPSPQQALAGIRSRDVVIVPVLMCDGVLYRKALPAALKLAGRTQPDDGHNDGHILHLCRPVGLHPMVAGLIVDRAARALKDYELSLATTTLLLIGHGSRHDPASAAAVALQAERVRASSMFRSVMVAFIGQRPFLRDALAGAHQPLIGIALFTARGNHVVEDIEKQFSQSEGKKNVFLGALGEDDNLLDIIEHTAAENSFVGTRPAAGSSP